MVAAIAGVATVAGAAISSSAAGDAAEGQQQASREANQLQLQMFRENNALQQPAREAGDASRNRLMNLLGLGNVGSTGRTSLGLATGLDPTKLREQLLGRYTSTTTNAPAQQYGTVWQTEARHPTDTSKTPGGYALTTGPGSEAVNWNNRDHTIYDFTQQNGPTSQTNIDEAGLQAAMDQYYREQEEQNAALRANPEYGSLTDKFQFQTYTPDKFSFSNEEFFRDPSYQFRLDQGQKAIDRQGAAAGRFLSGSQLQASSDYNQGAASQEYQAAYGRAANTFNTNEGNRFGAFQANEGNRYNAFQTNFTNTVNPLLALSGAGQLATTALMNNNSQYASNVGANLMGAANASGAAGIASANSINQGIGNATNAYQMNQLLNRNSSVNNNPFASAYPAGANYAADGQ